MPLDLGSMKFFMGPHTLGAPDNLEDTIVEFIDDAKETLDVAVQELESESIARAFVRAKQRGVKIRMVLEGDYLIAEHAVADPFDMLLKEKNESNRFLIAVLWRAGIDVRTDYNPKIFHQKFMVRDVEGTRAALLTGSTNFTETGTHNNLNHIVTIKGKSVAGEYALEFEELWGGTFGANRLRHDPAPKMPRVSKISMKTIFAPDHMPEMEIMKQMLKGSQTIDFAIFTFSKSSGIDDTMIALARAGMSIRGIADAGQGNQDWAASRPLAENGVEFFLARKHGTDLGKLHHKLMVIDGQVTVVGSFNYTEPANMLNDENIIVIGDLEEDNPESIENQKAFGAYALAEIDRMIAKHGEKIVV
ncbi:MAG: phospholipase [Alphaproteobacteria bacterium]|nr:phospholipase [Alphaproteobacteria bacterium]